jgi:hypothetical protein
MLSHCNTSNYALPVHKVLGPQVDRWWYQGATIRDLFQGGHCGGLDYMCLMVLIISESECVTLVDITAAIAKRWSWITQKYGAEWRPAADHR